MVICKWAPFVLVVAFFVGCASDKTIIRPQEIHKDVYASAFAYNPDISYQILGRVYINFETYGYIDLIKKAVEEYGADDVINIAVDEVTYTNGGKSTTYKAMTGIAIKYYDRENYPAVFHGPAEKAKRKIPQPVIPSQNSTGRKQNAPKDSSVDPDKIQF